MNRQDSYGIVSKWSILAVTLFDLRANFFKRLACWPAKVCKSRAGSVAMQSNFRINLRDIWRQSLSVNTRPWYPCRNLKSLFFRLRRSCVLGKSAPVDWTLSKSKVCKSFSQISEQRLLLRDLWKARLPTNSPILSQRLIAALYTTDRISNSFRWECTIAIPTDEFQATYMHASQQSADWSCNWNISDHDRSK